MTSASSLPPLPGRAAIALTALAFAAYFIVLHALIVSAEWPIASLVLVCLPWLFALLSWLWSPHPAPTTRTPRRSLACAVIVAVGWVGWRHGADLAPRADLLLYLENAAFFAALFVLFAETLLPGREALVSRLARTTRNGDMPHAVARYARSLTIAWAGFFALVPVVSSALYFTQSRAVWSTFVNLAVGPLAVLAFVLEYAVRRRVLRDVAHVPLMAGVQAFRQRSNVAPAQPAGDRR